MIVRITNSIRFPNASWLSSAAIGPQKQNGRYLVEVRGYSGTSSWVCGLVTSSWDTLMVTQEYEGTSQKILLMAGDYRVVEARDRRGQRLLRFYYSTTAKPDYILFSAYGHFVPEASSREVQVLLEAEGYSRTKKNGDRWGLFAAPIGAIIAVEPYGSEGCPIYYQVTEIEVEKLGSISAVLPPEEW